MIDSMIGIHGIYVTNNLTDVRTSKFILDKNQLFLLPFQPSSSLCHAHVAAASQSFVAAGTLKVFSSVDSQIEELKLSRLKVFQPDKFIKKTWIFSDFCNFRPFVA